MVGTTENRYTGDPAEVHPLQTEIDYLLQVLGHYFPSYASEPPTITRSFAGLRVLPADTGQAFHRSRDIVFTFDRRDKPRLLNIYGGKLTSYRADADKVMHRLQASLPQRAPKGDTRRLPLVPA